MIFYRALIVWVYLASALSVTSADHYVRLGASGLNDGSDWNNAWSDMDQVNWGGLPAGSTLWVAGSASSYKRINITSGGWPDGNRLFIKRPRTTNAVPVAAAGWDSSFDSQVIIESKTNNTFSTSVNGVTIDGQIPYTGIKLWNTTPTNWNNLTCCLSLANSVSYVSVINCAIIGPNTNIADCTPIGDRRAFHENSTTSTNVYFGYNDIAFWDSHFYTLHMVGVTIEHNILRDNYARGLAVISPHNNCDATIGVTNCVWRYNLVSNCFAECIMMCFTSTSDSINQNWNIYGNLFVDGVSGGAWRFLTTQYVTNNNEIHVFNNTFAGNMNFAWGVEQSVGIWGPGCWASNNLVAITGTIGGNLASDNDKAWTNGLQDYFFTTTGIRAAGANSITNAPTSIFVDYANHNYHIVTNIGALFPRNKGVNMSAYVTNDFDGNPFGADGGWDIGAFEALGGGMDTNPPTVINVTSSTADGSYTVGALISIQIVFSEPVNVTGAPQLTLETGSIDRTINYVSGTSGSTLTFNYTVQSGDTSQDLDYTSTSALALNGGTIADNANNAAILTLVAPGSAGSLSANKNIIIDTTAPVVTITAPTSSPTYATNVSSLAIGGTAVDTNLSTVTATNTTTGSAIMLTGSANWSGTATLQSGTNSITVTATDSAGNIGTDNIVITYTPPAPAAPEKLCCIIQ